MKLLVKKNIGFRFSIYLFKMVVIIPCIGPLEFSYSFSNHSNTNVYFVNAIAYTPGMDKSFGDGATQYKNSISTGNIIFFNERNTIQRAKCSFKTILSM